MPKVKVDANATMETKQRLDEILAAELEEGRRNDKPERGQSEILKMLLRKGCRTWKQEQLLPEGGFK